MKRRVVWITSLILLAACGGQTAQVNQTTQASSQTSTSLETSSQTKTTSTVVSSSKQDETSQTSKQVSSTSTTVKVTQPSPNETTTTKKVGQEQGNRKVMLSVVQQYQQVWNYCAPTAVSMILSARGVNVSQFQLAKEMGTYEPFGTHNRDAIRILNKHLFGYEYPGSGQPGYRLETVTDARKGSAQMKLFKQRLIQNIKDGYPMYYTMQVSKVYPGKYGEHNVVGIGYKLTEDGSDIEYLYYLDPSPGVRDTVYGGLKTITVEELFEAMVICVEPNYGW